MILMFIGGNKLNKKNKYKLILFDFDGTILDILPHIVPFFNEFSEEFHFKPIKDPEFTRNLTLKQIIKKHKIPFLKIPSLLRKVQKLQIENKDRIFLYKGLNEIIPQLSKKYKLGILSSNSKKVINSYLKKNKLDNYFSFIIGYPRIFSKSVALTKILVSRGLKPSQVLYVGDEVRDIQATKIVGMDCASVTWGINSVNLLKKYNPKYIVNKPNDLLKILNIN